MRAFRTRSVERLCMGEGFQISLYHPRKTQGSEYFRWRGQRLFVLGIGPIGRAYLFFELCVSGLSKYITYRTDHGRTVREGLEIGQ